MFLQSRSSPQEPVAKVVDVAGDAPPAGHDELCAAAGLQSLQLLDPRMLGLPPEQVLLVVGRSENEVAQRIQQDNACDGQPGKVLHSMDPYCRHAGPQCVYMHTA